MATMLSGFIKNAIATSLTTGTSYPVSATIKEIRFYTGSQPISPEDIETGILLGTISLISNDYNSSNNGSSGLVSSKQTNAIASGIIGWARVYGSTGIALFDVIVTSSGNGGGAIVSNVSVVSGSQIILTNLTVSQNYQINNVFINIGLKNRIVDWIIGKSNSVYDIRFYSVNGSINIPTNVNTNLLAMKSTNTNLVVNNDEAKNNSNINCDYFANIGTVRWLCLSDNFYTFQLWAKVTNSLGDGDIILDNLNVVSSPYTIPSNSIVIKVI